MDLYHLRPLISSRRVKFGFLRYFGNIITFMRAPFVKYIYNLVSRISMVIQRATIFIFQYFHMAFLLLFSYVLLCDFFPLYDFPSETCAPDSDALEHVRRLAQNYDTTMKSLDSSDEKNSSHANIYYGLQRRSHPSVTELILIVWIFTLLCEEIRQVSLKRDN
jgi:hypothetical protein